MKALAEATESRNDTYTVAESTCNGGNVATCRIPLNVSNTVVLGRVHELQVGVDLLVTFLGFFLWPVKAHVPELELERLL